MDVKIMVFQVLAQLLVGHIHVQEMTTCFAMEGVTVFLDLMDNTTTLSMTCHSQWTRLMRKRHRGMPALHHQEAALSFRWEPHLRQLLLR
jgi:hypothetical protein